MWAAKDCSILFSLVFNNIFCCSLIYLVGAFFCVVFYRSLNLSPKREAKITKGGIRNLRFFIISSSLFVKLWFSVVDRAVLRALSKFYLKFQAGYSQ